MSIKSKLHSAAGHAAAASSAPADPPMKIDPSSKYRLRVTAGPSYDPSTHQTVHVNDASRPTYISNSHVSAAVTVRVRNYTGFPSSSPATSPYFSQPEHARDTYSIEFSLVPRHDIDAEHASWGNDFDHHIRDRLPPGANLAFRFVKEWVDPGLSCDMYADQPWMRGPALACWTKFEVGDRVADWSRPSSDAGSISEDEAATAAGAAEKQTPTTGKDAFPTNAPPPSDDAPLVEGGVGSGADLRARHAVPPTVAKRRKHFLNAANRREFNLEAGRCYRGDFSNGFLDFCEGKLRLPIITIGVLKYVNAKSHALRYVLRDWREGGDVYLVVVFTLLFGDELEEANRKEREDEEEERRAREGRLAKEETNVGPEAGGEVFEDAPQQQQQQQQQQREGASDLHAEGADDIEQMLRSTATADATAPETRGIFK